MLPVTLQSLFLPEKNDMTARIPGKVTCRTAIPAKLQIVGLFLLPKKAGSPVKGLLIWEAGRPEEHLTWECAKGGQGRMLREKVGGKGWV